MRARYLIAVGLTAAVAAACFNPSSEEANDPAADLLSELEPALLLPASTGGQAVISSAELTPVNAGPTEASIAPRPRDTPAHVAHTAHVNEVRPVVVETVAIPSQETVAVSAGAGAADEHAGHDHADGPSAPGILIRGGVDVGIFGDPCIPGGHRPGNGGVAGGGIIGGIADASMLGATGTMVNDQTPRIGQGNLPYPRNNRGATSRGGSTLGEMGGGGRVFIR